MKTEYAHRQRGWWFRAGGVLAALLALGTTGAPAEGKAVGTPGYFRFPAASADTIVFTAEGDLWRVSADGGTAARLTTHPGLEAYPAISPDGRAVAFVGAYEGPAEVYVMPLAGGVPRRLTWLGAGVRVVGWSPTGEVLFTSTGLHPLRESRLAAVHAETGKLRPLALDAASGGAYLDRTSLVFTRLGLQSDNVRAYRGGAVASLWRFEEAAGKEAVRLTDPKDGNALMPMPWKSRIVFLSDRDGVMNLWSMDRDGKDLRQLTRHRDFEVRSPSVAGSRVTYQHGAGLRALNLETGADQALSIALVSDFDQLRERWIRKPLDQFTSASLARDGTRIAVTARGRIATAGVGELRRADLAVPAGSRARNAVFSSDGKAVYAFVDASGEEELWQFPADGSGPGKALTQGGDARRWSIWPSPDGKWVVHDDKRGRLSLLEVATGKNRVIDDPRGAARYPLYETVSWAADGSAFALAVYDKDNADRRRIALYRLPDGERMLLTSQRYDSYSPAFSPDGRWLYFISDRHFQAVNPAPWGDRNMGPFLDKRGRVYALSLQVGTRLPFQARDELETPPAAATAASKAGDKPDAAPGVKADDKPDGPTTASGAAAGKASAPRVPAIVWEGLSSRLHQLPLPAGNYTRLAVEGKRLWWLEADSTSERKTSLRSIAIDNVGLPTETFLADIREFALSGDGRRLFIRRWAASGPGDLFIVDAAPKAPTELPRFQVRLSDWQFPLSPREEFQGLFMEAWRLHRDHFYDPGMHGVDWLAVRRKYEPLVARVSDRHELADLQAQMIAELQLLHSQVGSGDARRGEENVLPASLGAELTTVADGARIDRILQGDPELIDALSPLAAPSVAARAGEIIVEVDGRPVSSVPDIAVLLRDKAGKQVLLALRGADGKVRKVVAKPVNAAVDQALRLADWQWQRRSRVESASNGRYGYVHLRAMGPNDIATFAREFYAVSDREGLIVDVRNNSGGSIDSTLLEKLMRRGWAYWQRREGGVSNWTQQHAFRGPIVVLANERTYSDGEFFTEGFKRLGLGTVIGKRTTGAGVWLSDRNRQADGGIARAAEYGVIGLDGGWLVEGKGVSPDVEVDNPPHATFRGEDAQLAAALRWLDSRVKEKPVSAPAAAAYPRVKR